MFNVRVINLKLPQDVVRLLRWRHGASNNGRHHPKADEQPLRAELFNVHQLEQHARALAQEHVLAAGRAPDQLVERLSDNEEVLVETYDLLVAAVEKKYQITPAAEWLLDNFFVIEEQIRTARRHLPRAYSEELPQLADGPQAGLPRAYGIAMELIAHADASVDATSLSAFVSGYQAIFPLTLGELWALPTVLRLALIENLRRMAARVASALSDRDAATVWAERMVRVVEQKPSDLIMVLADLAREDPPLTSAFVAELTRHLHGQGPHFAFAQSWLEHRLAERGSNIGQLVQIESQTQAADQVSIGNSITSLRTLGSTEWRDFVEAQSVVEQTLRTDPQNVYAHMNVGTRDAYRHAVEEIAKFGELSEPDVAEAAVRLARAAAADRPADRTAHVGFYLIDKGRATLEHLSHTRIPARSWIERMVRRFPLAVYLTLVTLLTASMAAILIARNPLGNAPPWMLVLIAVPILMCGVQLSIAIVNWLVTTLLHPRPFPRMDFRDGIPEEHRTMVVIPTLLSSHQGIQDLLERLELHYVANRDQYLYFALLTDLKDAGQEQMPEDAALLDQAREGIESLNQKYQHDRPGIFFLFHRPRRWHEPDRIWMASERKRGKLKEFTALLRGGPANAFSEISGELSILPDIQFVITLDTDTQLPRDAARELVGAMAHPLNRPVMDAHTCCVTDGYGILQPRVAISLPSASRSWFARLFAGDSGLDPYTRVVSDVYQDLFGQGSYIGKGIYDVDTFNQTCTHFPDNTVLSHDLIEGACARSALVTEVELYEDHPSRFLADASRRHRWIRGDWQIARWLWFRVPGGDGKLVPNTLSAVSRWKIFDNLRRSLVPPAMIIVLLAGWLLPWPAITLDILLLILAVIAIPHALAVVAEVVHKPSDLPWPIHLRAIKPEIARRTGQILYSLVFLPHDAWISVDAITRTLTRVLWTRRKLLEWQTSGDAELGARKNLPGFFVTMRMAVIIAFAALVSVVLIRPENLVLSAPLLAIWLMSPAIAWGLNRQIPTLQPRLSEQQHVFLRRLARKTWRYFEEFVTAEENWLPPDNFQVQPLSKIATRTSPTNIGMALLSNLAASDFGYCSASQFLLRTQKTLAAMERLERYQGHFYNWYDTRSLRPLWPLYVSTVDSGNLAMHLLVLRQGLLEHVDAKILPPQTFSGLRDTVWVLSDLVRHLLDDPKSARDTSRMRETFSKIEALDTALAQTPDTLNASFVLLGRAADSANEIAACDWGDAETHWWAQVLLRSVLDHLDAAGHMAPWVSLNSPPESLWTHDTPIGENERAALRNLLVRLERVPTLRQVSGMKLTELPLIDEILAKTDCTDHTSQPSLEHKEICDWLIALRTAIASASESATARIDTLNTTAQLCVDLSSMDFTFLFDETRNLWDPLESTCRHASLSIL